jgi:ATP-binding cassette, subfamily B, multidrug efflux pump
MKTFDIVKPYLRRSVGKIALGILVLFAVDAIQLVIPKIMQYAIDHIQHNSINQNGLALVGLAIFGMAIGIVVMRYFWRVLIIGNSFEIEAGLRQDFYNHLLRLSQNYFNRSKIGDLMAHATNDLNAVRMLFGMGFIAGSDIVIMTIASFAFMVSISFHLTMLAIIPLPILTIIIRYFGKKMHKRFAEVQGSFSAMSGAIQENITGIRVVKAFVQEESEIEKIDAHAQNYVKQNISMARISGVFHPMMGFVISISMILNLVFGGKAAIDGNITIGEFIAFYSYLGMLVWPMIAVGFIVDLYQRGTASLKRLNKIFLEIPEMNDEKADSSITTIKGKIEIRDLYFRYNDESPEIFVNLTTSIDAGKTLAVVGPTGCGKTTLVDLLTRVYPPPAGSVLIDDHDLYEIPYNVLHTQVSMVPQDIFLFSDTITNNIRLGRPDATIEDVTEAAKASQVHEDIEGFELGYETIIGERGVTLSGGQKQRVAIARALLCNPSILILDDALSAVDTKTEKYILENLIKHRKGKTTIIIAHRISSVQHAEKIIVIEKQHVAESGSHEQLIAMNGIYKALDDKQKIEERLEGTL